MYILFLLLTLFSFHFSIYYLSTPYPSFTDKNLSLRNSLKMYFVGIIIHCCNDVPAPFWLASTIVRSPSFHPSIPQGYIPPLPHSCFFISLIPGNWITVTRWAANYLSLPPDAVLDQQRLFLSISIKGWHFHLFFFTRVNISVRFHQGLTIPSFLLLFYCFCPFPSRYEVSIFSYFLLDLMFLSVSIKGWHFHSIFSSYFLLD